MTNGIFHEVDSVKSGWSMVFTEGPHVIISKYNIVILSLKITFILANSAYPDEMSHHATFYLALHRVPMYPFRRLRSPKCSTLTNELMSTVFVAIISTDSNMHGPH